MNGDKMPEGLSYPEKLLYLCLRQLYDQYRKGIIDRDTAVQEKKRLMDEHRVNEFNDQMGKRWVELIRLTDTARCAYRKNRTLENADKLVDALDGRLRT